MGILSARAQTFLSSCWDTSKNTMKSPKMLFIELNGLYGPSR